MADTNPIDMNQLIRTANANGSDPNLPREQLSAHRLTVTTSVVYEVPGIDPIACRCTSVRAFEKVSEEPYARKIEVTPNWKAIDFGWNSEFRNYVVLECLRTADFNVLTPGIQQSPIEIRCGKNTAHDSPAEFLLLPGMCLPVLMASIDMKLFVRCTDKVKLQVRTFPAVTTDDSTEEES